MIFHSIQIFASIAVVIILLGALRFARSRWIHAIALALANVVVLHYFLSDYSIAIHLGVSTLVFFYPRVVGKAANTSVLKRLLNGALIAALIGGFVTVNYQLSASVTSLINRLGISYILFRHIQYIVDCSNGKVRLGSWIDYLGFVTFFPNFLAGPIDTFRNHVLWTANKSNKIKNVLLLPGIGKIGLGIVKKYALVPLVLTYATDYTILEQEWGLYLGLTLSLVAYSAYIYLDFSGYSDLAIGTGYLLGIRTPENFRSPYLSLDLAAFWRRWHITFSNFLRDLIFKPIVGLFNLFLGRFPRLLVSSLGYIFTFVICGIWHGNTWNFVLWGLWHGVGLVFLKLYTTYVKPSWARGIWYDVLSLIATFLFVSAGWIFFHYSVEDLTKIWWKL